jgi:hypothetical protein
MYYKSIVGSGHLKTNTPCQDASAIRVIGENIILVWADGAGSSKHSQIASKCVVDTTIKAISGYVSERSSFEQYSIAARKRIITKIIQRCIRELNKIAYKYGFQNNDLYTTFNLVIRTPHCTTGASIGDGFAVIEYGNGFDFLLKPKKGQYENSTYFINSIKSEFNYILENTNFNCIQSKVDFVFCSTDGLDKIALKDGEVYIPFFVSVRDSFRDEPEEFKKWFETDSKLINATTDDRSILIYESNS